MIVIFAESVDLHAKSVQQQIWRKYDRDCVILDTATFPQSATLWMTLGLGSDDEFRFGEPAVSVDSRTIRSIWRRRARVPNIQGIDNEADRQVATHDSRMALSGFVLRSRDLAIQVINDPCAEYAAENKVFQLSVAHRLGFRIPQTLITNDPIAVVQFRARLAAQRKRMVFKAFSSPTTELVPTRLFVDGDEERLTDLRYSPVIFQEFVEGRDVRITVVGDQVFSAEILSCPEVATFDWRLDAFSECAPFTVSEKFVNDLLELQKSFGLQYGAFDFKWTADGQPIFLEVNPSGQFLFKEIQLGLQISAAFAELLNADTRKAERSAFH